MTTPPLVGVKYEILIHHATGNCQKRGVSIWREGRRGRREYPRITLASRERLDRIIYGSVGTAKSCTGLGSSYSPFYHATAHTGIIPYDVLNPRWIAREERLRQMLDNAAIT